MPILEIIAEKDLYFKTFDDLKNLRHDGQVLTMDQISHMY